MKTLIINGSPRVNGDTAALVSVLREHLQGDVVEISAYRASIRPCIDCRCCKKDPGCVIKNDMQIIYDDDFDNVVIASPLHMSNLTGPLVSLASRFQAYYAAKRFLSVEMRLKPKKAALILVGGGDGGPDNAICLAGWIFKKMNAHGAKENSVFSLRTDEIPSREDTSAVLKVIEVASRLNRVL